MREGTDRAKERRDRAAIAGAREDGEEGVQRDGREGSMDAEVEDV